MDLGKDTLVIYYESALRLKLPVTILEDMGGLHIPLGKKNYYFFSSIAPFNNSASMMIVKNRYLLHLLLKNANFPVPNTVAFNKNTFTTKPLDELIQSLKFPLVVKRMLATPGEESVVCNIRTQAELVICLTKFFDANPNYVQIEEYQENLNEYRVLVSQNKIVAVVQRMSSPSMGDSKESQEEFTITLPKINARNANYFCRAAQLLGIEWVSFDVLCEDINSCFAETKWVIVAANYGPSLAMYENPSEGKKVNVSIKPLMRLIFRHPLAYLLHRISKG